jgi:hypothetical protein
LSNLLASGQETKAFIPQPKQMFHVKHFCKRNACITPFLFWKNAKIHAAFGENPPTKSRKRKLNLQNLMGDLKNKLIFKIAIEFL